MPVLLAMWAAAFGIWPLAHPSHMWDGWLTLIDLTVHAAGIIYLGSRYQIVRRDEVGS